MAITEPEQAYGGGRMGDLEKDAYVHDVHSPTNELEDDGSKNALARNLHGRHMQMIAIGGAIGAGLFVGSGGALSKGGPASLVSCN